MANRILKPDSSNNLILQDGDSVSRVTLNSGGTSVLSDEGGTSALSIQADGDIDIAENIYLASGKGIYFDGGTTSENYLGGADAYEEGIWAVNGGNFGTFDSVTQTSKYVKIGKLVFCSFFQTGGTIDPTGSNRYLQGLPFAIDGGQVQPPCGNNYGPDGNVTSLYLYDASPDRIYFDADIGPFASPQILVFSLIYYTSE